MASNSSFSPETHSHNLYKSENSSFTGERVVEHEDRVYFEDANIRKDFFEEVRAVTRARSWAKLAQSFGMRRTVFQNYQYGIQTFPKNKFELFLSFLTKEKRDYFFKQVSTKPVTWGAVLGGKVTASKHPELIEIARTAYHEKRIKDPKYCFDLNMPLTEKLCEFIGAFIGDGYCGKYGHSHPIGFVGDRRFDQEYLLSTISHYAQELFGGLRPTVYYRKTDNGMNIVFQSKRLFHLLTERFCFPNGAKTYTVKIPDEIMNSEERFIFATIRGIFDTDGNVFLDKRKIYQIPYPRITLVTASEPLYLQVKEFLEKHFSLYAADKSKPGTPRHEIVIYGHQQVAKWMTLIGFSNERHWSKLKLLRANDGT